MAPSAEESNGFANGVGTNHSNHTQDEFFTVDSPNVAYTDNEILSNYTYRTTSVSLSGNGKMIATPKETKYDFKTTRKVPKVGVMLVGWGGNNGSTITAGLLANKYGLAWETREGIQKANYYGSVVMGSTVKLGIDSNTGNEVNIALHDMLPMVHPNDLVVGGWDISSMNLADAMDRAKVLQPGLKQLVRKEMSSLKPLPSIYYPDFIAANQEGRADNLIPGSNACWEHVEKIKNDIK
jgi:myo-inositol-1-phosphate synthase